MENSSSPRGSSRSNSAASSRMSSKGPSHSTPVKGGSIRSVSSSNSTPISTPIRGMSQLNSSTSNLSNSGLGFDSIRADMNLSDIEMSYRGSESMNRSAPVLRDHTKTSSYLVREVRRNLSGALGVSDLNSSKSPIGRFKTPAAAKISADSIDTLNDSQQAKLADYENQTIQKQRQELALLVAELRDRDRELNEMVAAHQKQLAAWDQDRQKIINVEEKCSKLEREMHHKNDDLRGLMAKLRMLESEEMNKSTALNSTQEQLALMSEQHSHASLHLHDLESKIHSLTATIHDMSSTIGRLEAREQELVTVLQLKDRDLSEASTHIAELGARHKKMETQYQDSKTAESDGKRLVTDWKNKYADQKREVEYTRKLLHRSEVCNDEQHVEIQKLRQEISTLKKEVTLASEREKRKDQLLDLQKSKQDRTDSELANVRQLYERQQRDLSMLHLNLESTKELLLKNNIDVPGLGCIGLPRTTPQRSSPYRSLRSSKSTNDSYRSYEREPQNTSYNNNSYNDRYSYTYDVSVDYTPTPHPTTKDTVLERSGSGMLKDNDLNIQRAETPVDNIRTNKPLSSIKQSSVKETDSPATKLHKLLTESRDMVQELEQSVADKEAQEQDQQLQQQQGEQQQPEQPEEVVDGGESSPDDKEEGPEVSEPANTDSE